MVLYDCSYCEHYVDDAKDCTDCGAHETVCDACGYCHYCRSQILV